ncbi:VOC family protein [Mycobacterium haemophilum]|uniref:PhnB-like domain-containing protein n=1 Tax=Mycobacterium haemophilum TaxID=29311 RepID=A0A0I9UB07_9MYCO|nr:VOC family protein [Mycobacterium haemophilum]KLO26223.1 hypothetical protein ABH39_18130 [Mycobacterium haemophilum]KLO37816.1 hypothetical protein ABH38_07685 [Mycobacterium haemophilum]KLO39509.1 hypothetical protein ABH37_18155 [Mycobacterium haemophilum]KLO55637.1 hypothetical protein ABH36_06640 [Mycobacterium haemophilum]
MCSNTVNAIDTSSAVAGGTGGPVLHHGIPELADRRFTEAVSFMVNCKDQDEVDYYWNGRLPTSVSKGELTR